jgi:hypothetical protein
LDRPFTRPQPRPDAKGLSDSKGSGDGASGQASTSSSNLTANATVTVTLTNAQPSSSPLSQSAQGPPRPRQAIPIAVIDSDQQPIAACDEEKEVREDFSPKKIGGGRKLSAPEKPNFLPEKPPSLPEKPAVLTEKLSFLPPQLRKFAVSDAMRYGVVLHCLFACLLP